MVKKFSKDVDDFTTSGITLGVGTGIVAGLPGGSAITPAFGAAASMFGPVGTVIGGKAAFRGLKGFKVKKSKKIKLPKYGV